MNQKPLSVFQSEYLQMATESRADAAVRELAEHCVDLIDEFEDDRWGEPREDNWTGPFERARQDCRRYAEDVKDELFGYARLLAPLEMREWRQIVLEVTRRRSRWEDERKTR